MNAGIGQAGVQIARRVRQVRTVLRTEGPTWLSDRVRMALADRIKPKATLRPVLDADVLAADLTDLSVVPALPMIASGPIRLNWIMLPPSAGSGGHTTIFRMIRYLETRGYASTIYFYDPYRGDHDYYAAIVRQFFGFHGPVRAIEGGMDDAHAVIATSWPTAYPAYTARSLGKKFYFVQDFEPLFHPTSTDSILAENTYRMRLHAITAGSWLATKLARDYGMAAGHFDFGCDTSQYNWQDGPPRRGIAFYARPDAARRAYELGLMTLEVLKRKRPDLELHFYGDKIGRLPFDFIDHGLVSPARLNAIYNQCCAGLTLSLTNVSLVPHEMLAAGCIPVVNDAEQNRIVLDNAFVRYAPASPHDLATALEEIASAPDQQAVSRAAAESVHSVSWETAGGQVDTILRRALSA